MEKIDKEKDNYLYSSSRFIDIFKLITYSLIGIFIFFIPIKLDGQTKTILYHIAYRLQVNLEFFLGICTIVYITLGTIKELFINHKRNLETKKIYTYLRLFSIFIIINIFYGKGNNILLNQNIMFLIKEIILNLVTVLPLSAIFMPFIMEYGLLDIVESYCHKFMKKTFKLSGKTVVNIMIYIFTDCFCGYFMTNKLYKEGKLRKNEVCIIVLNFSISSFFMINYICEEFYLKRYIFLPMTIIILFIGNIILCRIYPLNKKSKVYYIKTTYKETIHKSNKLKNGIKKYIENKNNKSIFYHMINNLEEMLTLLITLIPNIVLIIYFGNFVISNEFIIYILKSLFNPISLIFKIQNYNQFNSFIINIFYNDIVGIDLAYKSIDKVTKTLMGIIVVVKCTSLSTSIVYSLSCNTPIDKKDFIICYFEKIFITIFIYFTIYYFYIGYIR